MVVKNRTEISGDLAVDILIKTTKKNIFSRLIYVIVIEVIGALIIALGAMAGEVLYIVFGIIFVALGIIFVIYNAINLSKARSRVIKNNPEITEHGVIYDYEIKEQSFNVVAIEGIKHEKYKYEYSQIKKIYEYAEYYEVNLKDYKVLYVYKNGFESERMIEFFIKNLNINKKKIINKIKD